MDYGPIARIIVRYIVGAVVGMDAGATLAGDPDVITMVALGIGMAVEVAYGLAKRKGWAT
jgi:sulfopyruvate decarboxylase TPP-binding subunit